MTETIAHPDGEVRIAEGPDGTKTVEVFPSEEKQFVAVRRCKTSYSNELIRQILDAKGIAWLCDEINRDEDPNYVEKYLTNDLEAYFGTADLAGKRVLDFGSGSGASTAILARTYPDTDFIGVELLAEHLVVAQGRAEHHHLTNVRFFLSPSESSLPADVGEFDLVIMSAVVEHLLPDERKVLLPLLWSVIKPGGYLFLDQTPYRWFPLELHTTMLPFINYLPDRLAETYAKTFSRRVDKSESWTSLLRMGIRGATLGEISSLLEGNQTLNCNGNDGVNDQIDLWYKSTNPQRSAGLKRSAKGILKLVNRLTGICMVPDLAVAFRKK